MTKKELTKSEVIVGACILIGAQLAASSTASCVKALPYETPSVLRGLWRQVLTSFFFSIIVLSMTLHKKINIENKEAATDDEKGHLVPKKTIQFDDDEENNIFKAESHFSTQRVLLIATAVLGSTLQNDAIIFALQYASSAAVMCLCNTSECRDSESEVSTTIIIS